MCDDDLAERVARVIKDVIIAGLVGCEVWGDLAQRQATAAFLVVDAVAVLIYASFIVIWRHNTKFEPGTAVYVLTLILLGTSIVVCHEAVKV